MRPGLDPMAGSGLLASWLAAAIAWPVALLGSVIGQAAGALGGGCGWIGLALPLTRQPWALVNQPSLAFAARSAALGYWLGSLAAPVVVALAIRRLLPRPRSLAAELVAIHTAWACACLACGWLPLLDPSDGHLSRWLQLASLPSALVWLAPALAASIGLPIVLWLLAVVRNARAQCGRSLRLTAVAVHLAAPAVAWATVAALLAGSLPTAAAIGMTVPVTGALLVAWFGYPTAWPRPLRGLDYGAVGRLALAATVLAGGLLIVGRPAPEGTVHGLLWGRPGPFNNIRSWIDAAPLLDVPADRPAAEPIVGDPL